MSERFENPPGESTSQPPAAPPASDLPAEVRKTIEQVAKIPGVSVEPQKLEQALLAVITKISFSHPRRGPLPNPQELADYDKVIPGSAERILAASEKQAKHRIALEQQTVAAQNLQSGRGQLYGFVIAIVCLVFAFITIIAGHDVAGTIMGSIDLVALVTVFVLGKASQRANLRAKAKAVPEPPAG